MVIASTYRADLEALKKAMTELKPSNQKWTD